jgi:hypothetical protein
VKEKATTNQETDEELRCEADLLLASGLQTILNDYGAAHVIGSYALHLMVWRDLDIHIVQPELDKRKFFELGGKIADLLNPQRMHYRDETSAATQGLPRGLYWGVYLGNEREGAWKIDIWMTGPDGFEAVRAHGERIQERLADSNRPLILKIKSACWRHPQYRREFSSGDIYDAVLEHSVTDIDGFWKFLKDRNRVL